MMRSESVLRQHLKRFVKSNAFFYNTAMLILRRKPVAAGVTKKISGKQNKIQISGTVIFVNSKIDIVGNNNEIRIKDFSYFRNVTFLVRGDNNRITISESVHFHYGGSLHIEDHHCLIEIGEKSTFEDVHIAVTEPASEIVIGKDCMFAYDIDVRTGDSHSIIDATTGRRINPAANVRVGDHVWVAPHCSILKGVDIKQNSVVATRSVITRSYNQQGIIIGGSPSKILKENITWDRRRIMDSDMSQPECL